MRRLIAQIVSPLKTLDSSFEFRIRESDEVWDLYVFSSGSVPATTVLCHNVNWTTDKLIPQEQSIVHMFQAAVAIVQDTNNSMYT